MARILDDLDTAARASVAAAKAEAALPGVVLEGAKFTPVLEAKGGECRYWHGDPKLIACVDTQTGFCGRPTGSLFKSWCPEHRALIYAKEA